MKACAYKPEDRYRSAQNSKCVIDDSMSNAYGLHNEKRQSLLRRMIISYHACGSECGGRHLCNMPSRWAGAERAGYLCNMPSRWTGEEQDIYATRPATGQNQQEQDSYKTRPAKNRSR